MRFKRYGGPLSRAFGVGRHGLIPLFAGCVFFPSCHLLGAQQQRASTTAVDPQFMADVMTAIPPAPKTFPLYGEDPIPNSKSTPDQEAVGQWGFVTKVSRPTIEAFLPAKAKANGTSILIFPGGGYEMLSVTAEGELVAQFFQDHGTAAFLVKYRLPSDTTMMDKSIGPLQDAEEAVIFVRQHAKEWHLDPEKLGVIGFSAGGHLAATLGTHFEKSYVTNPDHVSLRPDFMVLVYPVISMDTKITHMGSRIALLGKNPTKEQVTGFSNELQVAKSTPPALILQAADDRLVDVDNSIVFFEALRRHDVPVDMTIFDRGEHGFFFLPHDRWETIIQEWLERNGWVR